MQTNSLMPRSDALYSTIRTLEQHFSGKATTRARVQRVGEGGGGMGGVFC